MMTKGFFDRMEAVAFRAGAGENFFLIFQKLSVFGIFA
jgi:hypothetical protein